jgi:hypothetical protein
MIVKSLEHKKNIRAFGRCIFCQGQSPILLLELPARRSLASHRGGKADSNGKLLSESRRPDALTACRLCPLVHSAQLTSLRCGFALRSIPLSSLLFVAAFPAGPFRLAHFSSLRLCPAVHSAQLTSLRCGFARRSIPLSSLLFVAALPCGPFRSAHFSSLRLCPPLHSA